MKDDGKATNKEGYSATTDRKAGTEAQAAAQRQQAGR
jgi:hypothetical protein